MVELASQSKCQSKGETDCHSIFPRLNHTLSAYYVPTSASDFAEWRTDMHELYTKSPERDMDLHLFELENQARSSWTDAAALENQPASAPAAAASSDLDFARQFLAYIDKTPTP